MLSAATAVVRVAATSVAPFDVAPPCGHVSSIRCRARMLFAATAVFKTHLSPGTANTFGNRCRSTRLVSVCMNCEKAFVSEELMTLCIQVANVSAHCPLCCSTMASSQAFFHQSKSFCWAALRPAPWRATLSSTSTRFFRDAAPLALLSFAPSISSGNIFIAALQASLLSISCWARFVFANSASASCFLRDCGLRCLSQLFRLLYHKRPLSVVCIFYQALSLERFRDDGCL